MEAVPQHTSEAVISYMDQRSAHGLYDSYNYKKNMNFFRCGILKVAAPELEVFPVSKCCCIHDDIYWRWPTLTTLKPFLKIDCGTQQLQKAIPSKLKMCIWKGRLESKVIWSLMAVSQGQKVNHLFLVNKSMNSNRTSYAMRAWLVWKTQCSCPSYFKSASQVLLLHFLSATEMKLRFFNIILLNIMQF